MKTETVAHAFETYRKHVLPPDASTIQVQECARAFYAGAYFLLMNVAHNIGDASTDEDEGIRQLEALQGECEAYGRAGGPLPPEHPPLADRVQHTIPDPPEGMRARLKELGQRIGDDLPPGWGFTLLLFTYGEGGSLFYISSAEREDMMRLMREFIARNTQ